MTAANEKMKAIGFTQSLPISDPQSLVLFDADYPKANSHDVIVEVSAVSINPADAKIRIRSAVDTILEVPKVIGYDAVGVIVSLGNEVTHFSVGDRVYYAGDVTRQGSNAQYQAVDSRLIALAPKSLTDAEASVLPLTALSSSPSEFI